MSTVADTSTVRYQNAPVGAVGGFCPSLPSLASPRSATSRPLNCSIFVTDIAEFSSPKRTDDDRAILRSALYRLLMDTFDASGPPWADCLHQDRGDGILTIVPPMFSTTMLVDPLLTLLGIRLRQYNRQAGDPVRIRMRVALHAGPVLLDGTGFPNQSVIHAARMLDAPVLKRGLATTGADLALMVSAHVYDTVIRQAGAALPAESFRRVRYRVKESRITSWMCVEPSAQWRCHPG